MATLSHYSNLAFIVQGSLTRVLDQRKVVPSTPTPHRRHQMRTLPAIVKVKASSLVGHTYYVGLAEREAGTTYRISETRRLGFVEKDGSKWYAYARRTDVSVTVALGFYKTLKAAIQAVVTCFVQMLDEVLAYEVEETIAQAQAKADQDAPTLLGENKDQHALVVPLSTLRSLLSTNEELAADLHLLRGYLSGSPALSLATVREFAYTGRMIEHELIRRATAEEDEFGGDFDAYADAMYRRETGESSVVES